MVAPSAHSTPPAARRALVIRNPRSRHAVPEPALEAAAGPLRARGWELTVRSTTAAGEATALAAEAAGRGLEVVVACGGDGTVHEVVNGLAGTGCALGVIPAGTANVWAGEAGVSRHPAEALELLRRGRRVRADLGVAELAGRTHRFLLMCGFGLDGEVVRRVGEGTRAKRLLGRAAYAAIGLGVALRRRPVKVTLEVDGARSEHELLLGVAGNTRRYGGVLKLTSGARVDDGRLDLVLFAAAGPRGRAAMGLYALRALRGGLAARLDGPPGGGIAYRRGAVIELRAERSLPVQADGEYLGETGEGPLRLRSEPAALTVLMAPRPQALLGERGG